LQGVLSDKNENQCSKSLLKIMTFINDKNIILQHFGDNYNIQKTQNSLRKIQILL